MGVEEINKDNFDEKIMKTSTPVFVDFWAEWCGPCRMVSPIVEELSKDFNDRVKFFKINVDNNSDIAAKYGVMSIPTLIIFKNGEIVEKLIGAAQKTYYAEKLELILNN